MKKYFIQTYGCQSNIKDSQSISGMLEALEFVETSEYNEADVIIINSCSVRQKAEDKVYGWGKVLEPRSAIPNLKLEDNTLDFTKNPYFESKNKKQIRFLVGCMVGSVKGDRKRYKEVSLAKRLPWVDYLLSPEEEYLIPEILKEEGLIDDWSKEVVMRGAKSNVSLVEDGFGGKWAYVNISTGCDNFCTFCVVPYARGKEISRPKGEIIKEVKNAVSKGYTDIMFLGQNVNSWGLNHETKFKLRAGSDDKIPFATLIRDVHEIKGVTKIAFMSSNPFDFTADLIDTLVLPKVDKHLHIAVQSGDNEVLKSMNRRHTIEEFEDLIFSIKSKIPEMTFGTDIIVGFPGETDKQFENTVKLFRKIKFNVAFISIYSIRKGTIAEKKMVDDVPLSEKKRRHAYLTKVWKESLRK